MENGINEKKFDSDKSKNVSFLLKKKSTEISNVYIFSQICFYRHKQIFFCFMYVSISILDNNRISIHNEKRHKKKVFRWNFL